jgi:BASS family bile acid:Na+ symporter
MNADRLINVFAAVTLIELMLTIGLGATMAEVWAVARDWRGVLRAMVANYVLVPAAAVGLVLLFHAQPMVAAGVMIVAVCPGAPYAPPFTALARGRVDQAVGLMVILAASSAVLAPLLLRLLLPLVFVAAKRPALALRLQVPLRRLSTLLNLALVGLILAVQFRMLAAIQARGYAGMLLLLAASAAAGWLLARPKPADRRTLAITTSVRNAGVGMVIAGGSFPGTPAVTFTTAYGLFQILAVALAVVALGRTAAGRAPAPAAA